MVEHGINEKILELGRVAVPATPQYATGQMCVCEREREKERDYRRKKKEELLKQTNGLDK